jgi:hypothetical protein
MALDGISPSLPKAGQFRMVYSTVEMLRYRGGESRAGQERKRILLRSIAIRFLMKNYFGRGRFDWHETYAIHERCGVLLGEFPKLRELPRFQVEAFDPVLNKVCCVTPMNRLAELKPDLTNDTPEILEAKREALIQLIAYRFELQKADRPPNYREIFDPNTPSTFHDRAMKRGVMQDFMRAIIGEILLPHLEHCDPQVREALSKHVIEPELPFGVELPE